MRALFCLLGFLVGACGHATPPKAPTRVEMAADLESKTIALVAVTDEGKVRPYCSGVWVGPETILTASHCIDLGPEDFFYVTKDDVFAPLDLDKRTDLILRLRKASILATDEAHDIVLLRSVARAPSHGTAVLSNDSVHAGQFAQAVGHSVGLWWSYSAGEVAAVRKVAIGPIEAVWVQATTPISPGNSGCGLFDEQGRLIGMAESTLGPPTQNLNFFVSAQYIQDLLRVHP